MAHPLLFLLGAKLPLESGLSALHLTNVLQNLALARVPWGQA